MIFFIDRFTFNKSRLSINYLRDYSMLRPRDNIVGGVIYLVVLDNTTG